LKPNCDELLSNFAVNCNNLRQYTTVAGATDLMAAMVGQCSLTLGWKQLTPRLLSGTFRDFQGLSALETKT